MTRASAKTRPQPSRQQAKARLTAEADKRLMRGAASVIGFVFDIPATALLRETRGTGWEAQVRQILLAVVRRAKAQTQDGSSIQRIGRSIGRDRTTVAHALHKVEAGSDMHDGFDVLVDTLATMTRQQLAMQEVAHNLKADLGVILAVTPE